MEHRPQKHAEPEAKADGVVGGSALLQSSRRAVSEERLRTALPSGGEGLTGKERAGRF